MVIDLFKYNLQTQTKQIGQIRKGEKVWNANQQPYLILAIWVCLKIVYP